MKTTVENLDPSRVELTVEVPYEKLKPSLDAVHKEISSQIQVPGFRRGHVPNRVINQRVGRGAVTREVVNNKLSDFYQDAITGAEWVPMFWPEVNVVELPNVTGENGGQPAFTAEATVRPVIKLPDLSKAKLTVDAVEAIDEDVDIELDNLRARSGSLKSVGRKAKTDDFVTTNLKAAIDDEEADSISGVSYEIGKGNMLKSLDTALRGLKIDELTTSTAGLTGGEHAGEQAEAAVTVIVVKQRELPKTDDEFTQLASELDIVEELREDLVKQVTERKAGEQAIAARDVLLEHLRSEVAFNVPEAAVEAEVAQHLRAEGKDGDEEYVKEIHEGIVNGVCDQITLDVLAKDPKVGVAQDEPLELLFQIAQQYGTELAQFLQGAQRVGQTPAFVSEVARNKSLVTALRQAAVVDSKGETVDLSAFIGFDKDDAAAAAQAAAVIAEGEGAERVHSVQGVYELRRIPRSCGTPPKSNRRVHLLLEGEPVAVRGSAVGMTSPALTGMRPG